MASWLGFATTTWTHSPSSIPLPLKRHENGASSSTANERTLADICKASTPPCTLNPFLPGGDAQTIYSATYKKPIALLHYKRRIFTSECTQYPGCFAVDFVTRTPAEQDVELVNPRTRKWEDNDWERYLSNGCIDSEAEEAEVNQRPIIVALHGISGGSQELYLRQTLDPLASGAATSSDGKGGPIWDCLVVNSRGCANSPVTGSRLFNARATWDIRQLLNWLHEKFPHRKLYAIGFSLGANILINYLGEEGTDTPVSAAVVCSNPWDLEGSSQALKRSWKGREIYYRALAAGMKKVFEKHVDKISQNPDVDVEAIRATKYLDHFDTELQCPSWGYPTTHAYYRDASSVDPLLAVRVPVLAVNAEDDPIAPMEVLPYDEARVNPYVVLCTTSMGGHLSWFEWGGNRWFTKPVVNFLRTLSAEVDFTQLKEMAPKMHACGMPPQDGQPAFDPVRRRNRLAQ